MQEDVEKEILRELKAGFLKALVFFKKEGMHKKHVAAEIARLAEKGELPPELAGSFEGPGPGAGAGAGN